MVLLKNLYPVLRLNPTNLCNQACCFPVFVVIGQVDFFQTFLILFNLDYIFIHYLWDQSFQYVLSDCVGTYRALLSLVLLLVVGESHVCIVWEG